MEIFEFSKEERETTINYQNGKWSVWSSIPDHIKKLIGNSNIKVESTSKNGTITSVGGEITEQEMYLFIRS